MSSSKPNYLSKATSPDTITVGIRASTYELGRDTNIQSIAMALQWPITSWLCLLRAGDVSQQRAAFCWCKDDKGNCCGIVLAGVVVKTLYSANSICCNTWDGTDERKYRAVWVRSLDLCCWSMYCSVLLPPATHGKSGIGKILWYSEAKKASVDAPGMLRKANHFWVH